MNNHFYTLFSTKTENQLKHILDNKKDYQKEAFEAAIFVLNEKFGASIQLEEEVIEKERCITTTLNQKERKPFFRTLSLREVYSSICVSLMFYSGRSVFNLYYSEPWYKGLDIYIWFLLLLVMIPVIHIFYKIEHKRRNDFEGRFYHTFFLLIVGWFVICLLDYLVDGTYYVLSFRLVLKIILGMLMIVFAVLLFEFVYFLLNQFLSLFKWRIW